MNVNYRDYINLELLDVIDDYAYLLDTDGLWGFLENILINDKFTSYSKCDNYTLGLFIMELYDDNIDEIVNQLVSEGWHKWSHLDKFNHFRSISHTDRVTYFYENCIWGLGGLPSSTNPKEIIPVDLDKYKTKIDFTSSSQDFRDAMDCPLTLPLVVGTCDLKRLGENLLNTLYIGIEVDESYPGGRKVMEPHICIDYTTGSSFATVTGQMPIIYDLAKYHESDLWEKAHTLLPKEILEKYNLPMYQS